MQVAFVEGDVASRFSGGHARSPHSTVLVYGLAAGIPGLLLFFEVLRMAFRNLRCHPRSDIRRSVVLSVAPVLPGMTANTFADPGMWGPFAFWVPLLFCLLLPAWDGQPPNESEWGQLTSEARSMRQREGPRLVPATALSRPG